MTRSSKRFLGWMATIVLLLSTGTGAWFWQQFAMRQTISKYVGSAGCVDCHIDEYADWRDSLHAKMMRHVEDPGVVVADLSPDHPDITFDPSQAVWAIGSKWEQQFMGEESHRETLLPGAWEVARGG